MKKDYEELEEKVIKYQLDTGNFVNTVVAGCHYDIGITLVEKEDKEEIIRTCLSRKEHGKGTRQYELFPEEWSLAVYRRQFHGLIEVIKRGVFTKKDRKEIFPEETNRRYKSLRTLLGVDTISEDRCAFR